MPFLELIVLALVQGVTEFLPISSSGHLVLVPRLTGWPDQGLDIDIAVHFGTLAAVVVYCRGDLARIIRGAARWRLGAADADVRLALNIAIATVPVAVAGLAAKPLIAEWLRSVEVIAWATVGFGALLYLADRMPAARRDIAEIGWVQALAIGCAQALALVPGTSRSGITMTAARALGFDRRTATRFSFLISIPTIAGAGLLTVLEIGAGGNWALGRDALIAAGMAFVTALGAMSLLMRWVESRSFTIFVVYRVILGAGLLLWLYG